MPNRRVASAVATAVTVLFAACTHAPDVTTSFPSRAGDSGALDVVLNDASSAVTVAIDDALVVDRKPTRHVHVDGVPAGRVHLRVAASGRCEQALVLERDVRVIAGQTSTVPLPGPAPSIACSIYSGLSNVALEVGMVAIAITLAASTAHHNGGVRLSAK